MLCSGDESCPNIAECQSDVHQVELCDPRDSDPNLVWLDVAGIPNAYYVRGDGEEGYAIATPIPFKDGIVTDTVGPWARAIYLRGTLDVEGEPLVWVQWDANTTDVNKVGGEDRGFWVYRTKGGDILLEDDQNKELPQTPYWARHQASFDGKPLEEGVFLTPEQRQAIAEVLRKSCYCEEVFWCTVCQDHVAEERYGWSGCTHLRYIEHESTWGGVGYSEGSDYSQYQEATEALLKFLGHRAPAFTQAISQHDRETALDMLRYLDPPDEAEASIAYLETLDQPGMHQPGTPEGWTLMSQWMRREAVLQ